MGGERGTAEPRIQDEPAQIGRYHVRGLLGRGGFATVYRAWDPLLSREIALKVLLPHLAGDPELRARFLSEARVIAGLRHPAIAVVHDVGEAGGLPFFAMELIEGQTLAQRTADGRPLPLAEVIEIAERLCAAVDQLHAAGILHRDIKASNVMVDGTGRVVLMDFGIARSAGDVETTRADALLGTPLAMAPEQVRGERAGSAADIYAIGVLIYQLLAGQPPFTGDAVRILHAQAYESPPPLRGIRPDLPDRVAAVVESALAKDPARRPAPARALATALADAAVSRSADRPVLPAGRAPAIRPGRTRSGSLLAGAVAVTVALGVVALLLVASIALRGGGGDTEQGSLPPVPLQEAAARPEVTDLRVYDNVFSRRELAFAVGDSVAACFTFRPGGDPRPLLVVATSGEQPPSDPNAPLVVARSAPLASEASATCHTVPVRERPLPAGVYWLWVLHGDEVLAGRSFIAQPRPGDVVVADNFDDPTRGVLPHTSPDPARFAVGYVDGAYAIAKTDPAFAGIPFVRLPGTFENVSIAVDVRLVGPAAERYITLGCRTSSPALDNGYRFSLEVERGTYLLDRWDGGRFTTLDSRAAASAIRRGGQSNRVEMTCAGETIAVSINGARVATIQDGVHRSGLLWLGVESDPARRHSIEARFDNLVVVQQ